MSKKKLMALKDVEDNVILLARKYLKRRIMYPDMNFRNNAQERSHILELVKRTIESGESNSALIIGPRGSGKTTVSFTWISKRDVCTFKKLYDLLVFDWFDSSSSTVSLRNCWKHKTITTMLMLSICTVSYTQTTGLH